MEKKDEWIILMSFYGDYILHFFVHNEGMHEALCTEFQSFTRVPTFTLFSFFVCLCMDQMQSRLND